MKKIGKLQINSEKLMSIEELITLRGGYGDCHCMCYSIDPIPQPMGLMAAINQTDCYDNLWCNGLDWYMELHVLIKELLFPGIKLRGYLFIYGCLLKFT